MRRLALAGLLFVTAACGASPAAPARGSGDGDPSARLAALEKLEDEVLRDLAAIDRRFAQRARMTPRDEDLRRVALAAVLAEDPSVAVVDGAIDPFSFEARARGLAAIKQKVEAAPRDLPERGAGTTQEPRLERDLLVRLVDEELARVAEERRLPRSASALVRAVVETWTPASSAAQTEERDRWISRRLAEVRASLEKAQLDVVRARELDDALDALEHAIDVPGMAKSTAELVKLRDALEAQGSRAQPTARSEWADVAQALRAHLGVASTPEQLDAQLAHAEETARAAAASEIAAAKLSADDVAGRTAPLMFPGKPCVDAVTGSRVRALAPSPERHAACELRRELAQAAAAGRPALAVALASLHDHIVVARWALDVARGSSTIQAATVKHRLLARPEADTLAHLERIALARPASAIGAGVAAALLFEGAGNPVARGRAWAELGDVPLDVAARAGTR